MRSGLKQLATCLLVLLGSGAAQALDHGFYRAIDRNDAAGLASLLERERPSPEAAARVLDYAALAGDDQGVRILLAHGAPASQAAVQAAGDGIDPRSGFGGHLTTACYIKSVLQDPSLLKADLRNLTVVESKDGGTFRETHKPHMPELDASLEMKGILAKDMMKELIQFSNHEALQELLKTGYVPSGAIIVGLEAAARYGEDQCTRLLLDHCRTHKEIRVDWDRFIRLASDPDPEEPGSGGHPLLGVYLRAVRQSGGALAARPLTNLRFLGK